MSIKVQHLAFLWKSKWNPVKWNSQRRINIFSPENNFQIQFLAAVRVLSEC